jgi:multiple sugar transport system ATP-binding protein
MSERAVFLQARGLCRRFGTNQALKDVDFDLYEDELLVVLGATGAGKTTLLRAVAGLAPPDAGRIILQGRDVTFAEPRSRDVALVFQNFSLYPRWSVRKNLEFPLRAPGRNVPEAEIKERVEWAADLLKISRYLDRDAARLSGGEMQRVAIGRAIVRRPKLFLMDEPLTNLDAKLREALRVELLELRQKLGIPMLYVTHDQAEALSMADRIVVLSEGQVLQSGTPHEIYRRPISPSVAQQLGQPTINLLHAYFSGGQWVTSDGSPIAPAPPSAPERVLLGIRPEDIATEGGVQGAVVQMVEYMGPTTTLLVRWGGCDLHIVTRGRSALRPKDTLWPRFDPARIVSFPHVTQETSHVHPEFRTTVHDARRSDGSPARANAAQRA